MWPRLKKKKKVKQKEGAKLSTYSEFNAAITDGSERREREAGTEKVTGLTNETTAVAGWMVSKG